MPTGPKGAHQALVGTCRVQLGWGWEGPGGDRCQKQNEGQLWEIRGSLGNCRGARRLHSRGMRVSGVVTEMGVVGRGRGMRVGSSGE